MQKKTTKFQFHLGTISADIAMMLKMMFVHTQKPIGHISSGYPTPHAAAPHAPPAMVCVLDTIDSGMYAQTSAFTKAPSR